MTYPRSGSPGWSAAEAGALAGPPGSPAAALPYPSSVGKGPEGGNASALG